MNIEAQNKADRICALALIRAFLRKYYITDSIQWMWSGDYRLCNTFMILYGMAI
jgi:hypothetical protein